jgi:hypothetical protein
MLFDNNVHSTIIEKRTQAAQFSLSGHTGRAKIGRISPHLNAYALDRWSEHESKTGAPDCNEIQIA